MTTLLDRLANLPKGARDIAQAELRVSGELAPGAPLEAAFSEILERKDMDDCLEGCQRGFDEAARECDGDDFCLAKAALAMRKCARACMSL